MLYDRDGFLSTLVRDKKKKIIIDLWDRKMKIENFLFSTDEEFPILIPSIPQCVMQACSWEQVVYCKCCQ